MKQCPRTVSFLLSRIGRMSWALGAARWRSTRSNWSRHGTPGLVQYWFERLKVSLKWPSLPWWILQ